MRTTLFRNVLTIAATLMLGAPASSWAQPRTDDLAQARRLYNDHQYDAAIDAARAAARVPGTAAAAAIVLARAHLERFRLTDDVASLGAAREALKAIDATALSARDHVEYLIGLGQSLYLDEETPLDDRAAAAAEFFEGALNQADVLDAGSRDLLFDWWAMSLDKQAQQNPNPTRPLYERIVTRAEREATAAGASASALYWLAAGAAGMNDPQRAWGAAVAGWIRSGSLGPRGVVLRSDLDLLMSRVVLPSRARQLAPTGDQQLAFKQITEQWTEFKRKWSR